MVQLNDTNARSFLDDGALDTLQPEVDAAHRAVLDKSGAGSEMLGWRDLLLDPDHDLLDDIEATAEHLKDEADVLLCLGIGGSYLGARAVINALTPYLGASASADAPEVRFAGYQTSGAYLNELLEDLEGESVYVNVISKSGTTLETALSFRVVRNWLEDQYENPAGRILITTDKDQGALNALNDAHGFHKKYVIPDDVGGRFSVLTPVGLLPIAAAGIDIRAFFNGAAAACEELDDADVNHDALRYAALRYLLLQNGYDVETLAVFEPKLRNVGRWWQQLFGESEGKEDKGLFPTVAQYTTDLHSIGQYMQQGQRTIIETFLLPEEDPGDLRIPETDHNVDDLNYVAGKSMADVTQAAYDGTAQAHADGGVPNVTITFDEIAPGPLGELLHFFEHAVAVGGYLLDVNPFNQPGVEDYKREMYDRLGR
ncbi:MAG: glucose-6-phosphate isomerase [Bacteroidetes bacterium SW_9_63_38]|nr:MAG: glucose-6-phosphate isomerase [Bacteroidetes bacterium SW_9_63_38]